MLLLSSNRPKNSHEQVGCHLRINANVNGRTVQRKHLRNSYEPVLTLFCELFNSELVLCSPATLPVGYFAQLSGKADNYFLKHECLQNYSHSHFVSV